jgi:hypothetical protein
MAQAVVAKTTPRARTYPVLSGSDFRYLIQIVAKTANMMNAGITDHRWPKMASKAEGAEV